jgi:phosphate transport system substrate-binding protein
MEEIVKEDYSPAMRNMEGNQAILDAVKQDKTGIGYIGIGYIVDENSKQVNGINVLKVAERDDISYISPLDESKLSEYPIYRPLFQYTAKKPVEGSAVYNFLMFELSGEGQEIVEDTGFVRITSKDRQHNTDMFLK